MSAAEGLLIDDLARLCAAETAKFNRRQPSDAQFCFELLRRALAEGVAEAFTYVYQIYERQVRIWVHSHTRFAQTGESDEYFVSAAWSTFYFALRGQKFAGFPSLPQVLAYLKVCVHTAIVLYLRDQQPAATLALDQHPGIAAAEQLEPFDMTQLTERIAQLLPDPQDRLLAHCVFAEDLKPRQIVKAYPGQWNSQRDITVALFRIRRILRNDAQLRRLFGIEDDERTA
jgi:hypothetical protein